MLYSVAQCDDALDRIDFEIKRLILERQHVVEMKELLETSPNSEGLSHNPYYNREQRMGTLMQKILQIISEHPGINGKEIKEQFELGAKGRQIQSGISRMAKKDLIENRGTHGLGAAWYIKE